MFGWLLIDVIIVTMVVRWWIKTLTWDYVKIILWRVAYFFRREPKGWEGGLLKWMRCGWQKDGIWGADIKSPPTDIDEDSLKKLDEAISNIRKF